MAEELPLFGVYLRESGIKNAKTGLRGGVALEFKNYDEAVKFLGFLKQKGLDCKNANLTRGKGNRKIKLADATLMVDKKTIGADT